MARIREVNWAVMCRLSRLLKDIGTDVNRSATYDFLVAIHNICLSCVVSEINGALGQNRYFFRTVYLTPPLTGLQLEFCNDGRVQKTRMIIENVCRYIRSFRHDTGFYTDGQTEMDGKTL